MKPEFTIEKIREFDKKGYRSIAARMVKSLLHYYDNKPLPDSIQEALNSGDGTYRP